MHLAAIDFETTGLLAGYHEPIQVAVVRLGAHLRPLAGSQPLYVNIRPLYPERADNAAMAVHGIPMAMLLEAEEPQEVAEGLLAWCGGEKLTPLAHSWPFESSFLDHWLGPTLKDALFDRDARDTKAMATCLNDLAASQGRTIPYPKTGLGALCARLGVRNDGPHDALWDAVAEAEVYRRMLQTGVGE